MARRLAAALVVALVAALAPGSRAADHGGREVKELSGLVETVSADGFPALVTVASEGRGAELGAGKGGSKKATGKVSKAAVATSSDPRPWPVDMPAATVSAALAPSVFLTRLQWLCCEG